MEPFGRKFRSPRPVSGWTTDCYYSLVQGPVIKWFGSSDSGFDQKLPLVKLYWIRPSRWWDNRFIAGLSPVYRFIAKFKRVKPTGSNLSNGYLPFLPFYLTLNSDLWADLRFKETR